MKKFVVIVLLFCLGFLFQHVKAQSFFSLKGGISLPVGEYTSNNLDHGAFTTTGLSFGVDGAWYFYKNFGIGADLTYTLHSVDAIALATHTLVNDPFLNSLNVRSEPYKMYTTLAGIYYIYPIITRLSVEPKLLAGMMFATTPFQLYEPEYFMVGPSYYKKTPSSDRSFAYKLGLSVKYELSNCIILRLSGDYTASYMSFGFYNYNGLYYKNLNIRYVDIAIGLVYKL